MSDETIEATFQMSTFHMSDPVFKYSLISFEIRLQG